MSGENPLWGAPRIHGELPKLGIDVGETRVGKHIVRSPIANVAHVPGESRQDHGVGRLLDCADDPVPGPIRVPDR
jgi:hypothetical protein